MRELDYKTTKDFNMRNYIEKVINALDWLVFAGWYKGGDSGDGILVTLISGAIWIFGTIFFLVYLLYRV